MRVRVRVRGMQLAAQFLDKNPNWTAHIRNDCVDQGTHEGIIIAVRGSGKPRVRHAERRVRDTSRECVMPRATGVRDAEGREL